MRYYFSSSARAYELLKELGARYYLMSFAVDAKQCSKVKDPDVIIDSGAFSIWNKGGTINIDDYIKFCAKQPKDWIFINLDVIPETGSTASDIEVCCKKGYENYLYICDKLPGRRILPVYHYGDNIHWLKEYMKHTDYIGISPANDTHENVKREFLRKVFNVTGKEIKTHGLGYSSFEGLTLFPFYSVDSISFKKSNINGTQFWNEDSKLWFYLRQRIQTFLNMERDITELWSCRGINWD